ncbi:LexA repressor [Anatilimnocola aggregata]|uniref:LexA repressor n=1 Tax=Anatilimnocola aggregata TaxID=2528021 RepID=A0A517YFE7_9BACT|nr:transcriptional repressor LexA [Anatilimnocola aggregata]QDU28949.1 LexA repressor [Anatilimnocola aggregata]
MAKRKRPGRPFVEKITDAQRTTLQAIRDFITQHEFPPTMQELGQKLKISGASAHQLVRQLERKGYVSRIPKQARSLKVLREIEQQPASLVSVELLGMVAAGQELWADENRLGEVMVESSLIGRGKHYALRVKGQSMINAGIREGDIVIVRQQPVAESGEIVVASTSKGTTVKRLFMQGDQIELRPENKLFKPILVSEESDLRILGKVIGIRHSAVKEG